MLMKTKPFPGSHVKELGLSLSSSFYLFVVILFYFNITQILFDNYYSKDVFYHT